MRWKRGRRARRWAACALLVSLICVLSLPVQGAGTAPAAGTDALDDLNLEGLESGTDTTSDPELEELFNDYEKPGAEAKASESTQPAPTQAESTAPADAGTPSKDDQSELDELTRDLSSETSAKTPTPSEPAGPAEKEALPNEAPALPTLSSVTPEEGAPNEVTNLEFKYDDKKSRVVVSSLRKIRFVERKSASTRQFVYLLENTQTPEKFQRAYDTSEFDSPVAMFTLFQVPRATPPASKLIVQLREDQVPNLVDSDRGLILEFGPPSSDVQVTDPAKRDVLSGDNVFAKSGTYTGEVIERLEIKNSDIHDVLRLIARSSGYNIVISDEVSGKIGTLSLTNIPWDQAFTLVLQSKKLGFVREGNVLRISTSASLRTEREEAAAVERATEKVDPLKTVLLPISYAKAAELSPRAKSFLTERGTVDVDIRTNTIIIKDIEKVVNRVQRLLQSLDTQPPTVSISVKIVEMRAALTRSIGMGLLSQSTSSNGINLGYGLNSADITSSGAFSTTISAPNYANLSMNFRLAELDNQLRLLANPSVAVVANQTGTVTQSLAFFIPTSTVTSGAVTTAGRQVNTQLQLQVTPIVSSDGSIFMTVMVNNQIPTVSGMNSQIASRQVQTQVLVENGDTAVIGGVFQNSVNDQLEGIPWLMRIPLLGYLFSGMSQVDNRTEIFMFLTAKIMNADEAFKRTL